MTAGKPNTGQVRKKMDGVCVIHEGRLLNRLANMTSRPDSSPLAWASPSRALAEEGEKKARAKAAPGTGPRCACRISGAASRARCRVHCRPSMREATNRPAARPIKTRVIG